MNYFLPTLLDENHIFWENFENFQPYPKDTLLALATFGRPAVFHAIYLKIAGCNILRASVHAKMREIAYKMANMATFGLYSAFLRMVNFCSFFNPNSIRQGLLRENGFLYALVLALKVNIHA